MHTIGAAQLVGVYRLHVLIEMIEIHLLEEAEGTMELTFSLCEDNKTESVDTAGTECGHLRRKCVQHVSNT